MADVVVVGGGFGGMASAARLAKLGHGVTLLEASPGLGGALGLVEQDGFCWDSGPTTTLLPAVVRDLFRKSGRAVEKEVDLVPVSPVAQHRFEDGTELDLPSGRAAQLHAVTDALGDGPAGEWVEYVDRLGEVWEALRRDLFERPWSDAQASKESRDLLSSRLTLQRHVHRSLRDERLRSVALHRSLLEGHQARDVPAWQAMWSYLEQKFGAWTVPGGIGQLTDVLADRLRTRGVTVLTGTTVTDLVVEQERVVAVRTHAGPVEADVVVVAIDPRRLPVLALYVERTMPAIPPVLCHLGLSGEVPDLPAEVVLHGDPMLVLRTTGRAPDGAHAWTLLGRGRIAEDLVNVLQRNRIRIRDQVEVRVDLSPRQLVEQWHGSPAGVLWQGRASLMRRLGPDTPIGGVFLAGAHSRLGAGLPSVGLSAALVAQRLGPA
ncbi:phytoene desaturase family protein [Nocardioides terrisoli]|uniref:phytoene desaturase family protein n=1 Tax=Nocardioides terrisoli TaxID=3388267 RepID=UPI00287BB8CA|nr:FAD-dependent oxidoreductase [Nocardioides marmorisolisilvae]